MGVLASSDRKRIDAATRALQRVPVQGSPEGVLDALARCAPIACGVVGTMGGRESTSIVSHLIRLPSDVSDGWATTPRAHLARMLAPLVPASPGTLISDTESITGQFREELELLQRLRAAGLGEAAGYKVSARPTEAGARAHRFMTFALDDGQTFTREHHHLLAQLQPGIHAALDRLWVPLVASQSILAQIVEEQTIGFMCLSKSRAIVEVNERLHLLVMRFLRAAHVEDGHGALIRFAERALNETMGQRIWCLKHEDGSTQVNISTHHLAKESHVIGEDLQLVMMQEMLLPRLEKNPLGGVVPLVNQTPRLTAALRELDDVEQKIVVAMVTTKVPNKQIAIEMGIGFRAFEKRIQRIADKLSIHVPRGTRVRPILMQLLTSK